MFHKFIAGYQISFLCIMLLYYIYVFACNGSCMALSSIQYGENNTYSNILCNKNIYFAEKSGVLLMWLLKK